MFGRKSNRQPTDIAAQARKEFWERKQAESDSETLLNKAANQAIISDWMAKASAARNIACEGQKNFRGV
jgi:hypothetical protein